MHTAPAAVCTLFHLATQDAEDDEMRHVAKHDEATEEKDGNEPGVTDLDSVNCTRRYCGNCQTENVVRRHSIALPDSILCVWEPGHWVHLRQLPFWFEKKWTRLSREAFVPFSCPLTMSCPMRERS